MDFISPCNGVGQNVPVDIQKALACFKERHGAFIIRAARDGHFGQTPNRIQINF
jgi:hypothetical protein